ncbi:hypothetical protein [Pseudomonas rossensis]|uniref:hypothetical protein n=1 Tax=Pseudomonas rossensis TaxID=2305471 RepID=UPI003260DEA0
MDNFKPLDSNSQGASRPVLYLNTRATQRDLMDAADWRLGAVQDLLSVLSICKMEDSDPRDIAKVSRALQLLVDDAHSLYQAVRQAA